eukprot:31152_1
MSSPQQESFQSMATVFILQDKTWIERGSGLVRFVFDLRTFALRLVIRPGTPDEFECKLRPRIRSKGPRAYVVRAQAENGTDEHILAVRFEREEDSRSFRRFVEKRDVDHNQKNSNAPNASYNNPNHFRDQTYGTSSNSVQQQQAAQYAQHRHGNRSSSNIAQGGPYNSYGNMGRNNPYSNTALQMSGYSNANIHQVPNASSPSNPNKHANYFWTCSRCLQMVDPSLSSCHVCGTMRQNDSQQVLQSISTNNHYNPNPHHHNHAPHQQSNATRATYGSSAHHQIAASSMTPSNNYYQNAHNPHNAPIMPNQQGVPSSSYYSKSSPKHSHPKQPAVPVLKLTTVNLEKHNKLFPPKRRNVKEIVHAQLEWLRTHQ